MICVNNVFLGDGGDKHFCLILFTGTRIRIDSVMRPRSSSRGAIQVPQLQLQLPQLQTVLMVMILWFKYRITDTGTVTNPTVLL